MPSLNPCQLPWLKDTPPCKIAGGISNAVDFAKDPLGYVAQQMQAAAAGLSDTVLPQMERLTHPDLGAEWFRSAYGVSFALSILMFGAFLGWNFLLLGRRRVSGDEVAETMGFYAPLFFFGCLFGPVLGTLLLTLTGAVTDSLIGWGVTGSVDGTTKALQAAIAAGSPDKIVGGAIVAIVFFGCLIVALLLAFLVLLIMLVTLYLTGAILPLSLVWLTNPRQRDKGLKLVMVWVGVCFSHVLLFLMLGIAFRMVGGLATNFDQPGMTILANLAVAVIALLMATLSPLGLVAFAPVGPSSAGGGGGPSMSVPGQRSPVGGYEASDGDSQTAQMARDDVSDAGAGGGGGGGGADVGAGAGGGLLGMLQASRAGGSSAVMEAAGAGGSEAAAGADDVDGETAGAAQPGADTSSSGLAVAGTSSADGTAAMTAGADRAEEKGDELSQAGQAATATGAGAPVGLAMQGASEVLKGTAGLARSTAELAQSAGDMATEHMDHGENHNQGGSGADTRPRR